MPLVPGHEALDADLLGDLEEPGLVEDRPHRGPAAAVLAATEQHQIAALVRNLADAAAAAEKHVAQLRDLITLIEAASGTGTLTVKT